MPPNTPNQHENDDPYRTLDFSCEYTDNVPKLLKELNISLAFTSYQAARLMLIRSDGIELDVNFKTFYRPMGLAATDQGLTLGTFTQVINFHRVDNLVDQLKQPLQKIEQDITAPRIKTKEGSRVAQENTSKKKDNQPDAHKAVVESSTVTTLDTTNKALREQREHVKQHQQRLHQPADPRVDSCFIARSSHFTGMINLHDIDWGNEGLWVVNSAFSCLCTLDPDYSFVPRWKPHFISDLVPEDRCHLNGMTLRDGIPAFVTTFSTNNEAKLWRERSKYCGTLMSVEDNEILLDGLIMPHSPRWHQDKIIFCNSGLGLVCSYNQKNSNMEVIAELQGFTRGIDFYGSIAFVGLSRVRQGNVLSAPPLVDRYTETYSGIWLVNLNDSSIIGFIKFTGNVDQIYDIAVIPDCSFPEIIEPSHPRMRNHFSIP